MIEAEVTRERGEQLHGARGEVMTAMRGLDGVADLSGEVIEEVRVREAQLDVARVLIARAHVEVQGGDPACVRIVGLEAVEHQLEVTVRERAER